VSTQKKSTQRPRDPFERAGRKLDEAARRLERETEQFITYLNDEVAPSVREHSSRGLRKAAEELARFADYLDSTRKGRH